MRQQGQRSWLRAFMLCTSFSLDPLNSPWTRMRLDPASTPLTARLLTVLDLCLFLSLTRKEGTCRSPQSLFLTGERSDAAVVGSGNKAVGKSPLLMF